MALVSASTLLTRIRRLADVENDNHISDTEIYDWIDESLGDYYEQIVQYQGPEFFARYYYATATKPATGVEKVFHLNVSEGEVNQGIYRVLGCDVGDAIDTDPDYTAPGSQWSSTLIQGKALRNPRPIRPFNLFERESAARRGGVRYRVFGTWEAYDDGINPAGYQQKWFISFEPWEEDIHFRLLYVPRAPTFTDVNGSLESAMTMQFFSGWEEYIVVDSAIKALIKQERDPSLLMMRKAEIKERIQAAATRPNEEPETVTDVHAYNWDTASEDYYDFWRGR